MQLFLSDFISFVKKPVFHISAEKVSLKKLAFLFAISFAINTLLDLMAESLKYNNIFGAKSTAESRLLSEYGIVMFITIITLFVPVVEELLGRYYLNKFGGNIFFLFVNIFIIIWHLNLIRSRDNALYSGFALFFIILLVLLIIDKSPRVKNKAKELLQKHFWVFFYVSAIAFGASHLTNYKFDKPMMFLPVILVLPQIVGAIFLGYVRMKFGFWYAVIFHGMHNLCSGVIFLLVNQS